MDHCEKKKSIKCALIWLYVQNLERTTKKMLRQTVREVAEELENSILMEKKYLKTKNLMKN